MSRNVSSFFVVSCGVTSELEDFGAKVYREIKAKRKKEGKV